MVQMINLSDSDQTLLTYNDHVTGSDWINTTEGSLLETNLTSGTPSTVNATILSTARSITSSLPFVPTNLSISTFTPIINYSYADKFNSTLINAYRTLITKSTLPPTATTTSASVNFSSEVQHNETSSFYSALPNESPLSSFLSSLSSSAASFSLSSELINLNESLSTSPASSLPSSPTSLSSSVSSSSSILSSYGPSSSLSSLSSGTLSSASAAAASSSFAWSAVNTNVNPNGTGSWSDTSSYPVFTNGSANFDNLISFWESIPYPKSGYTQLAIILLAFFITIIMILIVVGNLLVCIAITTEKSLKTVQNWFIASLAVSDLLLGLVIMPFSLAYELMGYWIFGQLWCDIHHALDVLLCTASINNLCLISLDRYWSVTQAVEYLKKRTPSRAIFMICFVWIFSALVSLPPLVGWKNESIEPGECQLSKDTGYVLYSSFGSFYVPAIVMVFVYAKIFVAARSRARKHVKKRKLLVAPEVTNDPTKDKSTTTTTCTSLSNPSPPDGNRDASEADGESVADGESIGPMSQVQPARTRFDNYSPCSTPTATTTPKVTFSPRDTVYGDDDNSSQVTSQAVPGSPVSPGPPPPQIIIETANSSPNNAHGNHGNSSAPINSCSNSNNNNNNLNNDNNNFSANYNESSDNSSERDSEISANNKNSVNSNNSTSNDSKNNNNSKSGSGNLSDRKSPKLKINIIDSTMQQHTHHHHHHHHHNRTRGDNGDGNNSLTTSPSATRTTNIPSILRQNGLSTNQTSAHHQPLISETRLTSGDEDSDAMESPVSKTSGSLALESKSFLSPSAAMGGPGGSGGLQRSPFGSTMSIADYDDSDLCNDSGEASDTKPKKKKKGKVQYTTPSVARRHTPSDAERHKRKIAKARERRATLILGLIMGSFILAWLPFFVMYLTSGLCKNCQITSGLTFGYWLGYCNSAINPIIYTVFNRDFRKAFRKILFR